METLSFAYLKGCLPSYISKYYTKREYKDYIGNNCERLVKDLDYVNKGDVLYRIIRPVKTEVDRIIDVPSPFSGYIKTYNMGYDDDDILMTFYSSLDEMKEDSYPYTIVEDKVRCTKRITWEDFLYVSGGVYIEYNIKDNHPCLHFRYKGLHLSVNDKLFFLDEENNPIIGMVVVKKEHKYDRSLYEVDFMLSETDLPTLTNSKVLSLYLLFSNDDEPITWELYDDDFQDYTASYCKALREANVSYIMSEVKGESSTHYDYCYVYLMQDTRNGYHKIGMSNKPDIREKTLQSEVPAVQMVCSKKYPSRKIAKAIEAALHNAYAEQRVRGEWFNLSPLDIQMLKETLS